MVSTTYSTKIACEQEGAKQGGAQQDTAGMPASSGASTLVLDFEQVFRGQVLIGSVAPLILPHNLVQLLGKGFSEAICQSLCHDVAVVIPLMYHQFKTTSDRFRQYCPSEKAAEVRQTNDCQIKCKTTIRLRYNSHHAALVRQLT